MASLAAPRTAAVLVLLALGACMAGYGKQPGERQLELLGRQVTVTAQGGSEERSPSVAVLAAGCFWGVELAFARLPGVLSTEVGYTGGQVANPTYQSVSTGETNHAEAVRVTYDSSLLSLRELLGAFFDVHDPTTRNRQGNDVGTQCARRPFHSYARPLALCLVARTPSVFYCTLRLNSCCASLVWLCADRSAIFVSSDEERAVAEAAIESERQRLGKRVATTVEPLAVFTPAEAYHQEYLAKKGQPATKGSTEAIRCYG